MLKRLGYCLSFKSCYLFGIPYLMFKYSLYVERYLEKYVICRTYIIVK